GHAKARLRILIQGLAAPGWVELVEPRQSLAFDELIDKWVVRRDSGQNGEATPPFARPVVAFVSQGFFEHSLEFADIPGGKAAHGDGRQQVGAGTAIAVIAGLVFHAADRPPQRGHDELFGLPEPPGFDRANKQDITLPWKVAAKFVDMVSELAGVSV